MEASFVFRQETMETRDKFARSGQQGSVGGTVVGYYVFARDETLRDELADMNTRVPAGSPQP